MILKRRIVIYAESKLGPYSSKTGNCAIRYFPEEVVSVIDSAKKGKSIEEYIGVGKGIPIVGSLKEAMKFRPDTFLVGSAPVGGFPDEHLLETVKEAIQNKLNIISGLHRFFSDMPEMVELAGSFDVKITDLRKASSPSRVSGNKWKNTRAKVILTVGADCNSGKLSTIYELYQAFRKLKIPSDIIGTGQTGIFLAGGGPPVDAIVSDYIAGAMESAIEKSDSKNMDFIFVEGQGALTHPAYSGVTMGLLHGSMPDAMIFCLDPTREYDDWGNKIPDLKKMIEFHELSMSFFKKSKILGISVITRNIPDKNEARETIQKIESDTGLPANDPYRFGCGNIVKKSLEYFDVRI